MSPSERVLLRLSRSPEVSDYHLSEDDVCVENALDLLHAQFGPRFLEYVRGKAVLDYGCGCGHQAVAYLLAGASQVTGVDILDQNLAHTRMLAERYGVARRLSVHLGDVEAIDLPKDSFDMVSSVNAFEHFGNPAGILEVCRGALKPDGRFLITFGEPWFHPYGSHMQFFTRVPWVHLLFSEQTVMTVRARFRHDHARRYHEVRGGLNQMSLRRFIHLVHKSGYRIELFELRGIKRLDLLTRIPLVREFFTNRINCILRKDLVSEPQDLLRRAVDSAPPTRTPSAASRRRLARQTCAVRKTVPTPRQDTESTSKNVR